MAKIVCKVQRDLVLSHIEGDDGTFVFILCRKGMEKVAGRKFPIGSVFLADTKLKFIKFLKPKG